MATVEFKLDPLTYHSLLRALKAESDGAQLRRQLAREWRAAGEVAANDARRSARAIAAPRSRHAVSLRSAIAAGVRVDVHAGAPTKKHRYGPSVEIAWHRGPMAKANRKEKSTRSVLWRAGWLLNKGKRWEHVAWGRKTGRRIGIPQAKGWFDDAIEPHKVVFYQVARGAVQDVLDRIESRSVSRGASQRL